MGARYKGVGLAARITTTIRLPEPLLKKLDRRAHRAEMRRSRYLENLIRKDVGMPVVEGKDLKSVETEADDGIFG